MGKRQTNSLTTYVPAFVLGIVAQMILNIPNRPWYDDGHVYRGDRVTLNEKVVPKHILDFYSKCESAKVLYVNDNGALIRWKCPTTNDVPWNLRGGTDDWFTPAEGLKLK